MTMTVDDLIERVEHWRARICPEWHVRVTDAPADAVLSHDQDSWIACTSNDLTVAEIIIHYKPELLEYRKIEIDRIIVHELIHPLLDRVLDHDQALAPHVSSIQFDSYKDVRRGDMEEFVNRVAHCIVSGRALTTTRRLRGHS